MSRFEKKKDNTRRQYPAQRRSPVAAVVALLLVALSACGDRREPRAERPDGAPAAGTAAPASGSTARADTARPLEIGLSEANVALLRGGTAPPGFKAYRDALAALRPDRYRLVVDWSKLQPDPAVPADLGLPQDGCSRNRTPPCAEAAGLRAMLEAIRDNQRAAGGGWEVLVAIYGVPDWAATPPGGCERPGAEPRARPMTDAGLTGYRALIRQLRALGEEVGVALPWWTPWNEPNHQAFISPQRGACDVASPPLAPAVYGRLVRAAREELAGSGAKLVLGELAGFRAPRARGAGVGEFIRALPDEVACAASAWSQHEYASTEDEPAAPFTRDAVAEAEAALDERPCTATLPVWVTETGVGGVPPGSTRPMGAVALARQCAAQAARLERWAADPRVEAVFQFTFREDVAYPVALADPGLGVLYPTYGLWRAWADARGAGAAARPAGCGAR